MDHLVWLKLIGMEFANKDEVSLAVTTVNHEIKWLLFFLSLTGRETTVEKSGGIINAD